MNKKKYENPEAEQFFVKYEENIMSPNGYTQGGGGQYGDDETNENPDY